MLAKYKFRILIAILVVLIASFLYYFQDSNIAKGSTGEGVITVLVIDDNENEIHQKKYDVSKNDTLLEIMLDDKGVALGCNNDTYSSVDYECLSALSTIREIKGVSTDWYNSYWQLFINNERAVAGVSSLIFEPGDSIEFRYTKI